MPALFRSVLVAVFLGSLTLVPAPSAPFVGETPVGSLEGSNLAMPVAAAQAQPASGFWASREGSGGRKPAAAAANATDRVHAGQIIGPDDRQRVNPTTTFPWSAVVSLEVDFDFGATGFYCSGAIVGPTVVLTAAHCVFDHSSIQGWATNVRVIPGRNGASVPFGSQVASNLHVPSGYISNGTPALDVAIVTLSSSIVANPPGRFRYAGSNGSGLIGATANIVGYPGEAPTQQWWHAGPIVDRSYNASADTGIISYPTDTSAGQSGSPIWLFNGTDRVIVGVHTRGATSSSCSTVGGANNCGTLLTNFIATQLESVGADPRTTATGTFIPETLPGSGTATPTPSPTPPTGGSIGGRGLTIQPATNSVQLSWQAGTVQTGYLVVRLSGSATSVLPLTGPLPANATSFVDNSPAPGFNCYLVAALGGITGGVIGTSDLLCAAPNTRSVVASPQGLTLRLNQSNVASLSWTGPIGGGFNGYLLVPIGGTAIPLSASATSTSVALGGPTCYVLFATSSGTPVGNSDIVCGIPGASTLGAAGPGS